MNGELSPQRRGAAVVSAFTGEAVDAERKYKLAGIANSRR